VKLKLIKDVQGLKAGREWNCPSAALGLKLIEEGRALAVEECDLHLNPQSDDGAESEVDPNAEPPAAEQPKAPNPKSAKKPKAPKPKK
jgi:hypothetical protein